MPEHRSFPRFVYLLLAAFLLAPLASLVAEEPLPGDPDFPADRPMIDITERSAAAASAAGTVTIFLQGKEDQVRAKRETSFRVTAVDGDGVLIRDAKLLVDYGDGKSSKSQFDRRARVNHTWKKAGSYKLEFELVDSDGNRLARGNFRLRVGGPQRYDVQVMGEDTVKLDEESKYRFAVFSRESRAARGTLVIAWGDGNSTTISSFSREVTAGHVYTVEGKFTISAVFTSIFGETKKSRRLVIEVREGGGTIDLSQAQIAPNADRDIENYRVTSTVTNVTVTRSLICIFHTKAGKWPVRDGLEGNPWVAVFYQGRLHAGTYEWLRPGQTCKGIDSAKSGGTHRALGPHIAAGPLTSWVPKKGEEVWFFVSTHSRLNIRSSNERAEPFLIIWPF